MLLSFISLFFMLFSNGFFYLFRKEEEENVQFWIMALAAGTAFVFMGGHLEVAGACVFSSISTILALASAIVILFELRKLYLGLSLLYYICWIAYLISLLI